MVSVLYVPPPRSAAPKPPLARERSLRVPNMSLCSLQMSQEYLPCDSCAEYATETWLGSGVPALRKPLLIYSINGVNRELKLTTVLISAINVMEHVMLIYVVRVHLSRAVVAVVCALTPVLEGHRSGG